MKKDNRRGVAWILLLVTVMMVAPTFSLSAVTLKVSSVAPRNSAWGRVLEKIASRWGQLSDGEVELRIFHNAIAGSENDVLRKMRVGQIHIGVFTSLGIGAIAPEILTLSVPGLIANDQEIQYVFQELGPELAEIVDESRFELLGWSVVGWIYPFAKEEIRTPEDLRAFRIATTNTNQDVTQLFRVAGFNPVTLEFSEWLSGLNSGLVGGFVASPIAAAGFQWFGIAKYMADIQLSPFIGAVVISDQAWRRVPARLRAPLKGVIVRELAQLTQENVKLESSAVAVMERNGLTRIELTEQERAAWFREFTVKSEVRAAIDKLFDRSIYNKIATLLREFRARSQ